MYFCIFTLTSVKIKPKIFSTDTGGITLSYITERNQVKICPNPGLTITWCGWQKCNSAHAHGPTIYKDYVMTFVLDGYGRYSTNGKTYELSPGKGFIITPGANTYYIADSKHPWEYIFVSFHGADASVLLQSVGLSQKNPVFFFDNNEEMRKLLDHTFSSAKSSSCLGYDTIGYFYRCIASLAQCEKNHPGHSFSSEQYVSKALAYMDVNYPYNISISDIVTYVGIDRSYFYRLFRNELGYSPQQWLIQLRLKKAVAMLCNTELPITVIANSVGFYDASHFTRNFQKQYGCTPLEYRQKNSCTVPEAREEDPELTKW